MSLDGVLARWISADAATVVGSVDREAGGVASMVAAATAVTASGRTGRAGAKEGGFEASLVTRSGAEVTASDRVVTLDVL